MNRAFEPPTADETSVHVPASSPETGGAIATEPDPGDASGDVESVLGLNAGDRRVLTVLVCVALALMMVHWYRLTQQRPGPIDVIRAGGYQFQLDVNKATWVEWMQLDRIGETLARRIVEDREQNGPFTSVDDLQRVHGIGPKTLDALREHLTCQMPERDP